MARTTYFVHVRLQQCAQVMGDANAQRLLARHERQAACKGHDDLMASRAHLLLIGLHGKVLEDQLTTGDAGNGHRAFHNRCNDLMAQETPIEREREKR